MMFELVTTYSHFNGDVVIVRTQRGCFAFVGNRNRKRPSGWAQRMVARANADAAIRKRLERVIEQRGVPCSAVYHPEKVAEVDASLQDDAVMAGKKRKKRVRRRLKRRDKRTARRLKRARKKAKGKGPRAIRAKARVARLKVRRGHLKRRMKRQGLTPRRVGGGGGAAPSIADARASQRRLRVARRRAADLAAQQAEARVAEDIGYEDDYADDPYAADPVPYASQPDVSAHQADDIAYGDPQPVHALTSQPLDDADYYEDDGYDDEPEDRGSGAGLAIAAVAAAGLAFTLMS